MTAYLGIDQSLTSTGIAVLREGTSQPLVCTALPTKLKGPARLAYIRDRARGFLEEYTPRAAALEGYSYGSTGKVFELGELGGVLKLLLHDAGVPFLVVPPSSLKKFIAHKSEATKEDMRRAVEERFGLDIDQEDACDAYGLARVARAWMLKNSTIRAELEVLHALTKAPAEKLGVSKGRTKISL